jgi:threonine dehydratase
MEPVNPTLGDIFEAAKRIRGVALKTPLRYAYALSELASASIFLKLEMLQETGSFKVRGAMNKINMLSKAEKARGVIAFSTGNHGRAVAYVAQREKIPAVVCVSARVPAYRVEAMRQLGAEVVQHGNSQDAAFEHALQLQKERGLTMIEPFDDPDIISGQGTIGLEILGVLPEVNTVIVPLSGGGLIAGIALAVKTAKPKTRIIGVSMDVAPAMHASVKAGRPIEIEEKDSLADALLGGIGLENKYTFRIVNEWVDEIILVSEQEIADGMRFALEQEKLVVEGAAAVGLSALIGAKCSVAGESVAVVLSGGNEDAALLARITADPHEGC